MLVALAAYNYTSSLLKLIVSDKTKYDGNVRYQSAKHVQNPYEDKPSKKCLVELPHYDCWGVRTDQSIPTRFIFIFGWI